MTDRSTEARERALARLAHAGVGSFDYGRQASHAALYREYARRMALWAEALECKELWPFIDVAARVFPARFSDEEPSGALFAGVSRLSGAFQACLVASVRFAEVASAPEIAAFGLPDPYEPAVRLFERRGSLRTEHGMVYVGTVGFPRVRAALEPAAKVPPVALDDASLDALDGA